MQDRIDRFLGLSTVLTGCSRLQLLGTAMTGDYLRTLDEILPAGMVDELLATFERLPAGSNQEAEVAAQILDDPKLGPVARNLILLWYCGTWTPLPDPWRTAYGVSPLDTKRVVSATAYQVGLQWVVAGAHPAGAQQQGFGAWSMAPARNGL
jgi:hypothetical protein